MSEIVNKQTANVTSYDLLKLFALVLMVIDHIGAYLMPEAIELRLIGRFSAPIWLFLIGYARSRGDLKKLLIAGVIVQISMWLYYGDVWTLDILFLMIISRLVLDRYMAFVLQHKLRFIVMAFVTAILAIPTFYMVMYGLAGFVMVMFGYLVRHRHEFSVVSDNFLYGFLLFSAVLYMFHALIVFPDLPEYSVYVLLFGLAAILLGLSQFKPMFFPVFDCGYLAGLKNLVCISGRYTLEFYVVHLLIFRLVSYFAL